MRAITGSSRGAGTFPVDELYSLREAIEGLALSLAVERATEADWTDLVTLADRMSDAALRGAPGEFARLDLEFHSRFYRIARHRRLTAVWESYRPTFTVTLDLTNAQDRDLTPSAEAHHQLLAAGEDVDQLASRVRHLVSIVGPSIARLKGVWGLRGWARPDTRMALESVDARTEKLLRELIDEFH